MKLHPILRALILPAVVAITLSSARATTVYALTNGGNILTFDHLTPGTITNTVTPDAAVIGGYVLLAIDIRPTVQTSPAPSNPGAGTLWAIGRSGTSFQLFVIDPSTGSATTIGVPYAAGIDSTPSVNSWGFDFDPSQDRIRLVDSATPAAGLSNNYFLNPNNANGTVTETDSNLTFASGDTNSGAAHVDGAAYTTSVFGGTTSLYFIDSSLNALLKAKNVSDGTVQTVGSLGVTAGEPSGFDIYQSLALFSAPTAAGSSLYSVNLTTGAATLVGDFPALTNLRGLAISISDPVPPPGPPMLQVYGKAKRTIHGTPAIVRGQATDDSGTVALSYRVTNRSASYVGAPYANPFSIKVRRLAIGTNRVIIRAIDPSGNITQKTLTIVRR